MTVDIVCKQLTHYFNDSPVWVTTGNNQTHGRVVSNADTPRSYLVTTPSGPIRRNRRHLNQRLGRANDNSSDIFDDLPANTSAPSTEPERDRVMTRTQTGTAIRPPNRLVYV